MLNIATEINPLDYPIPSTRGLKKIKIFQELYAINSGNIRKASELFDNSIILNWIVTKVFLKKWKSLLKSSLFTYKYRNGCGCCAN